MFQGPEKIFSPEHREQLPERKDWGVALGVPLRCEKQAFEIRDAILAQGVKLVVQLEKHPHITLFQGEFSVESKEMIERVTEETLLGFSYDYPQVLEIEMEESLHLREGNNNLFWNVKQTEWLTRLHSLLDERLRTLPEWNMMRQFRDRLQQGNLTEEERKHIQKHGVLSAGVLFLPHITIGRLADGADFSLIKDMKIEPLKFPAEDVLIGHIDRYGQIDSVKSEKELKQS